MINLIKKDFWFLLLTVFLVPVAYANALTLGDIIKNATEIVGSVIPLVSGLALVYFIYGLAEYVSVSGNEAKKEEGRNRMVWGIIALFVIISVWGLVKVLQATIWGSTTDSSFSNPPIPKM